MITKSVIPAAGEGSRLLPITNGTPKELLSIGGRPLIRFSIDESLNSGIDNIGIITRKEKISLNRYILEIEDVDLELHFFEQQHPRGLGHAVLQSEEWINNEDFTILLPDDIITHNEPCLMQLSRLYEKYGCSVIGVEYTENVQRYGIIKGIEIGANVFKVEQLVEKPDTSNAPSRLGIIGRYLLTPEIFPCISEVESRSPENVELTDAIQLLLNKEDVYAVKIQGMRFDCGNIEGYRRAVEEFLGHDSKTISTGRLNL